MKKCLSKDNRKKLKKKVGIFISNPDYAMNYKLFIVLILASPNSYCIPLRFVIHTEKKKEVKGFFLSIKINQRLINVVWWSFIQTSTFFLFFWGLSSDQSSENSYIYTHTHTHVICMFFLKTNYTFKMYI